MSARDFGETQTKESSLCLASVTDSSSDCVPAILHLCNASQILSSLQCGNLTFICINAGIIFCIWLLVRALKHLQNLAFFFKLLSIYNDDAEEYVWALNRQTMDATGQPGRPITICFAPANIDDEESGVLFFSSFFFFKFPSFIWTSREDYTKSVAITFPF